MLGDIIADSRATSLGIRKRPFPSPGLSNALRKRCVSDIVMTSTSGSPRPCHRIRLVVRRGECRRTDARIGRRPFAGTRFAARNRRSYRLRGYGLAVLENGSTRPGVPTGHGGGNIFAGGPPGIDGRPCDPSRPARRRTRLCGEGTEVKRHSRSGAETVSACSTVFRQSLGGPVSEPHLLSARQ